MPFRTGPQLGLLILAALLSGLAPESGAEAAVWVFEDERGHLHFSDVRHHRGYRALRAKMRPGTQAPRSLVPGSTGAWDDVISRAARAHQLPPALVKAVIHVESLFDSRAVSSKGARGLMQLMPATARSLGVDDPFNPWQNIQGGTRYLGYLMERFRGELTLALAAYHAGEGAVRRYGGIPPFPATRRYVERVQRYHRRYDADFR